VSVHHWDNVALVISGFKGNGNLVSFVLGEMMENLLFPAIEPYRHALLPVGEGHALYYEECGNPHAVPMLFLHGGPGSGCNARQRRFFDPQSHRVILFDQRGCGRSTPLGATQANTTQHLVADIEALRRNLGIERWLVFGGSWGATLALAYAESHAEAVRGMVLRGIFLGSRAEIDAYLYALRSELPQAWASFAAAVEGDDLLSGYHRAIHADDRNVALRAAQAWSDWEQAVMSLGAAASPNLATSELALATARVQTHYLIQDCFLAPGQLLAAVPRLRSIPCRIVQGGKDRVCPPAAAIALAAEWPQCRLEIIEKGGHSPFSPAMCKPLIEAVAALQHDLG
jgi:proline iminopeptidase